MAFRLIRNQDLVRTPWKNGGGTTAEVAVYPAAADLDDFDWRISMADVATQGPFSSFAGIDRTLALVEGTALDLDVHGTRHRLDAARPFLGFSGEAPVEAFLPEGPIRDLNIMTRRSRYRHGMQFLCAESVNSVATVVVVAALEDGTLLEAEGSAIEMDRLDIVLGEGTAVSFDKPVILVELFLIA